LLPVGSEPVFIAMLLGAVGVPWLLVVVASLGNILGAVLNWWLGMELERFSSRRWFPVPPEALERAKRWYHVWGRWTLLLSWMPIIGDPLTIMAGVMRERLWIFLLLVSVAKTCRFATLAYITLYWA
jgi:membrane protein YqaA with SNARE-associated domain